MSRYSHHVFICLFATLAFTPISGCGESHARTSDEAANDRPEALAWFDELSRRATQRDTAYVRENVRAHVLTEGPATNDPLAALCDALMYSYAIDQSPGKHARQTTLSVGCVTPGLLGGSAWEYSIDLFQDGGHWKLDSWPYDQRTLSARKPQPGGLQKN